MRCAALASMALIAAPAAAATVHAVPKPYPYPVPAWSPYVAGALIGALTLLSLIVAKRVIGASSGYADAAGLLVSAVSRQHVRSLEYFRKHPPQLGWTLVFVIGTILGAAAAAASGGEITGVFLQDLWIARFGPDSHALRIGFALVGGIAMAYGARLAGGCTSGHGISGTLQMSVGSWIAVICFFIGGIATAWIVYRL